MKKNYFYFLFLVIIVIAGFDITSGRLRWGTAYLNDTTSAYISTNKGVIVNGTLLIPLQDMIVGDGLYIHMGDNTTYPSLGIKGEINEITQYANVSRFRNAYGTHTVTEIDSIKFNIDNRLQTSEGTATASASRLTLPNNGNFFEITGTTTIDTITTTNWNAGSVIYLYFSGGGFTAITDGGPTGANGQVDIVGGNLVVTQYQVYAFVLDGTLWRKVGY